MSKRRFLPRRFSPGVRLQLTLWYTAIFALLLFLGGGILYLHLRDSLNSSLDTALQLRAQQIAGGISFEQNHIILQGTASDLPGFDKRDNQPTSPADVNFDTLVRLLDAQGHVVHVSPAFQKLRVPADSVNQPLHGTPWQGNVTAANGQPVRIYSRTIADDGHVFAIIQVGQSLALVQDTLQDITAELLAAILCILSLSALGSYWLAGRAFAPIRRLVEVARTIKEGDLRQRVPVPPTTDEVHALAVTLNEMLTSLEQTISRQRRFVSDASHELRTPVAVIRSKTDLALQQPCMQEEYISILHDINSESERLGRLIGDLLILARGDEGKTRFEMEKVPLHLVSEIVVASAESLALERGVALQMETSEPAVVYADEARLIQVIMNLLDNAILYTNAGGSINLKVAVIGNQAQLTVRDTGIGVSPEHLPHIFERFYRADPARTRSEGGNNGLGLSIVDWLVRAHKGTIVVESQVGQGSTFTVRLPLYKDKISPLFQDTSLSRQG
jgi:heavy metal sensor kinase